LPAPFFVSMGAEGFVAMTAFVLVHGAWVGSLYWRAVAQKLRSSGHDVYAPSLTGMGSRSHLLSRGTDLNLHVQDVANLVTYEDLHGIVLVGQGTAAMS
jgi:pimeloyl-ACP methyl ester carboxylesterase